MFKRHPAAHMSTIWWLGPLRLNAEQLFPAVCCNTEMLLLLPDTFALLRPDFPPPLMKHLPFMDLCLKSEIKPTSGLPSVPNTYKSRTFLQQPQAFPTLCKTLMWNPTQMCASRFLSYPDIDSAQHHTVVNRPTG